MSSTRVVRSAAKRPIGPSGDRFDVRIFPGTCVPGCRHHRSAIPERGHVLQIKTPRCVDTNAGESEIRKLFPKQFLDVDPEANTGLSRDGNENETSPAYLLPALGA